MIAKNLKSLVRNYPVAGTLNFTGLVCAFVAFSLIFLQVDYELSFDRCHPTAERVFRADKADDESIFRNILPRGFADDIIASSAHVEAGCTMVPFFGEIYFSAADEFNARFDFAPYGDWLKPIELVPLTGIYFRNEGNIYKSGSRPQLLLLVAVAFLILALGLINFTNFYIALTPLRIRSINLRKILGSSTVRLRVLVSLFQDCPQESRGCA